MKKVWDCQWDLKQTTTPGFEGGFSEKGRKKVHASTSRRKCKQTDGEAK